MNLNEEGSCPDCDEQVAVKDPREHVERSADLARVDFIEERHDDEHVEDKGVVLSGRGPQGVVPPTVDVEKHVAYAQNNSLWWSLGGQNLMINHKKL